MFHSVIAKRKKYFLKKICFVLKLRILFKFRRARKRRLSFVDLIKETAFCSIGEFEVTLNLIIDEVSF